jgi:hypothetical protein
MNKIISRLLAFFLFTSFVGYPISTMAQGKELVAYVPHYRLEQKGILIYKDKDGNWINGGIGEDIEIEQKIDLGQFEDQEDINKIFNVLVYPYDPGFMFSTEELTRPINKFCKDRENFIENYYNHSTDSVEVIDKKLNNGIVNLKYNTELTPKVEPLNVSKYSDEDIYILLGEDPEDPNPKIKSDLKAIRELKPTVEDLTLPVPLSTFKGMLNVEILFKKGLAVYGKPEDIENNEFKAGEYRYLGYDINGTPFTNEDFPNDFNIGKKPWEKNWIYKPWNTNIENQKRPQKSAFNRDRNATHWLNQIEWAGKNGWTGEKLIDYFMIQSPQTDYTPGSAIGWHSLENGKVLYQTFEIPPAKSLLDELGAEAYIVFIPIIIEYWVEAKTDNLAIKDIRNETSEIEYDKDYELKFDVYNMCLKDAYDVTVDYYLQYNDKLKHMFVDSGHTIEALKSQTGGLIYGIPEDYKRNTFELVAKLNMNEKHSATFEDGTIIEENTMEDNEISILIPIKEKEAFDLEVIDIQYREYQAGSYSPVIVKVRNNGTTNIATYLKLDVEGTVSKKDFFVPAGKVAEVMFGLQTPNIETHFKMAAKVDYDNKISESNEKNNTYSINSRTIKAQEKKCSPSYVTWTEYRSKKSYSSGKKIKTWTHTKKKCTGSGEKRKCKTVTVIDGYTVRFYAKLTNVNVDVNWINKEQGFIKSGYGIEVEAKADIVSNYDRPSQIKNVQRTFFYSPDKTIQMKGSNGRFELPVNSRSHMNEKMHYIPVNTSDGDYKISVSLQGASTPGGILNICQDVIVPIKGHMYEDDNTN